VGLKHVLRNIQPDCGNLHVDGSLMWFLATITPLPRPLHGWSLPRRQHLPLFADQGTRARSGMLWRGKVRVGWGSGTRTRRHEVVGTNQFHTLPDNGPNNAHCWVAA
jgi:hypothetical protein